MVNLKQWIPKLAGNVILVVGDVILDEYVTGKTTRLSREAPVPVLEFESRHWIPGGAANPSANIVALGSTVVQVGVVGVDAAADNMRQVLRERGIDSSGLITDRKRPTTVKTRIMAHMGLRFPQQVARLDTVSHQPIDDSTEAAIHAVLEATTTDVKAVLLSDYHAGLLTPTLVAAVRHLAADRAVLLTVDAQGELDKYTRFGVVKCNADDAREYLRRDLLSDADFEVAAAELRDKLGLTSGMVITRGARGATIAANGIAPVHCPAPAVTDVFDVVGAGDTTIAVLTLALAAGASLVEATSLANYASGLVVRRVGNYCPTPDELLWALDEWH
ncbi:MAG: bifunctional ADP-heptose synthase [Anaerolineae bacterium]